MQVVVVDVVGKEALERIPREVVAAVVVDRLGRRDAKEQDGLPGRHARARLGHDGSERVHDEAFDGVVVQGAERVGDVEAVVDRVDVLVEELVGVKVAMDGVLPSVEDEAGCETRRPSKGERKGQLCVETQGKGRRTTHAAKKNCSNGTPHQ